MALELKIAVDVEGNAKKELASIESSIKKVEGASKTAEPSIVKLATGHTKLSDEAHKSAEAFEKEVLQLVKADAATIAAGKSTTGYTSALTAATTATGLSTAALGTLTAGLAAVAVGYAALGAVLVKSTQHYFEHSKATKDSRDALKGLSDTWEDFQMVVGGSVLGGNFSIAKPITLLNMALVETGAYLAYRIEETKMWIGLLARAASYLPGGNVLTGNMFSDATGPADVNLSAPYRTRDPKTGMTQEQFYAEAQITRLHAELKRQETAAKSARHALAEHNREMVNFWATASPGVMSGIPGYTPSSWNPFSAGASIPAGSGLFDWGGLSPSVYGMPGSLPGATGVMPSGLSGRGGGWMNTLRGAYGYGMGLYDAGMNVWNSTDEGGAGSRALKGAASGAMAGTMIMPGIGTAIGAGVGALVGAIRGWLAPTEYEKRSQQLEKDRVSATGILGTPGLGRMWDSMGGNVPFGFDFLKTQAYHDPTAVRGYLDEMLQKHERLQAAMEKYGISWEELGSKAKQSQIDTMAEELILDFDVLVQAGADTNMVIEKMGGSINTFVQAALRTGSEVPAAMKPMIEQMIKMGLLTDETGDVFTDLEDTGITFAKTMTQGFDSIVEAINRVAVALGVTIPEAAGQAAAAISGIPGVPGDPGIAPNPGDGPYYPEQAHTGGYLWNGRVLQSFHRGGRVGDGFPIWAQSGEFVMSRAAVNRMGVGAMAAMNSGAGLRAIVPVVLQLDRRTLTEVVAETVLRG